MLGIDADDIRQAEFAARVTEADVSFARMSVWEIGALRERFDLVIFMGVLYHLRHPLLALDLIHEHVAKDLLLFQSMQRGSWRVSPIEQDYDFSVTEPFDRDDFPRLHFVEHRYANDETNWWIPNRAGVESMLRSSGFDPEAQVEEEVYLC